MGEKRTIERYINKNVILPEIYQSVKFKVLRSWKGIETAEVIVETNASSSCQYLPTVGTKIMVYAYEDKDFKIPFSMNYCSVRTFDDEKMKREFGEGKVLEESAPQQTPQPIQTSENFWSNLWKKIVSFFS